MDYSFSIWRAAPPSVSCQPKNRDTVTEDEMYIVHVFVHAKHGQIERGAKKGQKVPWHRFKHPL
jgi:hypothetical protein